MSQEAEALISVRVRQQEPAIKKAQKKARTVLRKETKYKRSLLKLANKQLTLDLNQAIEDSDEQVRFQFALDAKYTSDAGVLGIAIGAQDKL